MVELFQKTKFEKIALEDVEPILIKFGHEMNSLKNTTARKQTYIDKKVEVFKNAESSFEGQELIYSGFMDDIFSRNDEFSTQKEVMSSDEISELGIRKMFEDMPGLESEESAAQRRNQRGQGLKVLTPQQMLSRLPISLPQLKAGSNSEKLKNEIRQLLYSLYRSKKLSKTIYNNLINANNGNNIHEYFEQ